MGVHTQYACDRCQKEGDHTKINAEADVFHFFKVAVVVRGIQDEPYINRANIGEAIWCKECVKETKLVTPLLRAPVEPENVVTMESLVRSIVQDENNNRE